MAGKMVADAAVMVADAALNGVFQGLAQALTPIIQKKLGQFWGVDDKKLRKLRRYLLGIQPLLNDAETRQFTEDAVRSWVSDLRGVAYDLEDIVDEMNAELLRLQLDETKKSEGKQVVDFISTFFGAMENYTFNYQIAVKINEVMERWEEIVEYGNLLHLREGIGGKALEVIGKRRETTSFVVEKILGSVFFRIEEEVVTNRPTEETRYMSLSDLVIDKRLLSKLFKAKSLRTLKVISENINGILDEVIHNFERLHVLDLSWSSIMELPESIGNLKYLRYLSLQWNGLERLPDSICGLFNLQTLYLDDCHHLVELPKDMGSLINLRHLTLSGTGLQMLPDSICKLKKLQVIDLSCCKEFTALPIDIGSLINLRCLNLHGTDIQRLPNSICKLHDLQCLDLLGCRELSELPKEMSNLINLQKLEVDTELLRNSLLPRIGRFPNLQGLKNYVVAKESGIGQLRVLANLHGELNITDLENVQSAEEARTANLKDKNNIQGLGLCWSSPDPFSFRDENVEAEVLEALEPPCAELRLLVVENYGGFKFPSWMGDTSFSNLVEIELIDCRKCKLLGPLGQLPSLEKLVIKRMYALKHIGREVFGNGSFPSLRTLKLKHLPNLEGRFEVKDSDLLHLIELEVRNCPKLTELPVAPLTLRALRIYGCKKECGLNNLIFIPMLPSLKELEVGNGNEMVLSNSLPYLTSLSSLKVFGIRSVTLLQDGILQPLTNLERLIIKDCYKLLTLPRGLPTTLSDLDIAHCPNLRSLPKGFQNLTSLARLSIKHCPLLQVPQGELTNFPLLKVLRVTGYNKSILLNVLPNLSTLVNLVIDEFDWPSYLPDNLLQNLTSLQNLVIEYCAQLISLPNGLPSSLKTLYIGHCAELTSLPNELPSSLEKVLITGCAKVKSLPKGLNKLTSLEQLYIWKCPLIESFPEDGLPIDLLFLSISHCPTLVQRCRQQGNKEWNMTKHHDLQKHKLQNLSEAEVLKAPTFGGCETLWTPNHTPKQQRFPWKNLRSRRLISLYFHEQEFNSLQHHYPISGRPKPLVRVIRLGIYVNPITTCSHNVKTSLDDKTNSPLFQPHKLRGPNCDVFLFFQNGTYFPMATIEAAGPLAGPHASRPSSAI
ncbi:hypothetical protein H6P81_005528 [Aristolochia fimbriata]|uniref:Rx N-terminal domain-containing protein n=1 Tax=Aristolochia fimbriata TaxID=158543 RepID=A0AAV7EVF0_ARIFI|nr:hypothetical protein H6P81_005528 [Aristolochia fimbriata]